MAKTFPTDRFDSIPADLTRVGAHRSVPKRGRGWIAFAWAALATGILVAAGAIAITVFAASLNFTLPFSSLGAGASASSGSASDAVSSSPSPSVVETADPVLDPKIQITVLNGTKTSRLANTVGDSLVAAGWGGAAVGVGSRASAATDTVKLTVVYYTDAANEGAARAIAQQLKIGTVKFGNEYPSVPITVLLGANYTHVAG
ncbi:MAG: LytR C-terminal domain-containing protein [Microbacteriaceae bacterium]|nr:LytR C-terminal domain-containing protein [Microbacteriaceae bacterium]